MPLVPAICTQCSARLEVDPNCESAVCQYCGTRFVTEKAINNYNITYETNIGNLNANVVNLNNESSRDNRVKAGDTFIKLNNYTSAEEVFSKLSKECPYDYRGWWGLIKVYSRNFTDFIKDRPQLVKLNSLYDNACAVATPEEKSRMDAIYKPYFAQLDRNLKERLNDTRQKIQRESYEFESRKNDLESRISTLCAQQKSLRKPSNILTMALAILVLIETIDMAINAFDIGGGAIIQCLSYVIAFVLLALVIKYTVGKALDVPYNKKVERLEAEISSLKNELYTLSNANAAKVRDYNETMTKL